MLPTPPVSLQAEDTSPEGDRYHGRQRLVWVFEHPSAGVISRLTLIVSEGAAELGNGLSWVTVRPQTSTGNQNHPLRWPFRLVAISVQPRYVCR